MQITEVKVFPVSEEKLKAFVSVVFDGCFMVNDIKIIRGREGLFISMPSRKKKNGEFKDVAHPLNNETRQMIEKQVLAEYERVLAEQGDRRGEREETRSEVAAAPRRPRAVRPERDERPRAAAARDGAGSPPVEGGDGFGSVDLPSARPRPVPAAAAPAAMSGVAASDTSDGGEGDETTLEEVEEIHLRDSFWTVT